MRAHLFGEIGSGRASFRRQIILTFVVGFSLLVSTFIAYRTVGNRAHEYRVNGDAAAGLAQSLAVSSLSWVLADDVAGMQEVVGSFQSYPGLRYAMLLAPDGRVLAHSERSRVGLYASDEKSRALLGAPAELQTVTDDAWLIDIAMPVRLGTRHVGWARIGVGREDLVASGRDAIIGNAMFVLLATLLSLLAALLIANRLGARIGSLVRVAEQVEAGNFSMRADIPDAMDEVGKLAASLNTMLDALAQDEMQLRRSRAGLAEAQRIAQLGNWELDLGSNSLTWSDEIYRIFEIDPGRFGASYDAFINAVHPDDRELVRRAYSESIDSRQPYDIEHRLLMTDGRIKYVHEIGMTDYADDGTPIRSVGTVHDITERKLAEEELRRYKDHLEEQVQQRTADLVLARNAAEAANRAKSVFLANMSHELRTPLNAILGFSAMMRKDSLLQPEQKESLDIINRSGEHLLTLINDVLEMSKIEAGRAQVEKVPFDLGGMVRDVGDMMHVRAQEKGLQLLIEESSKVPRYINGDEARLRQVLINLVGNALKFTRQGGVTVRFGVKPQAEQERLLIEVEDSGIGIAMQDRERIFEPFVQLAEDSSQKGTGLGLPLARQYVQMMGGVLGIESTPGKGSVFRVELPLETVSAAEVRKSGQVETREVIGLAPGQPKHRVLIVEDQRENQVLLTRLMANVGLPVKVAENGERAVELFRSWHPHLIWMDRRLPVMDGVEATRRIRALPGGAEVKIVAVTASAFAEQREELFRAGMDEFIRKPYRFNEIYDCLARQLGVRYLYAGEEAPAAAGGAALSAEMLAALPQAAREALRAALQSLEAERIAAVIQQVAAHDPPLQQTLLRLAGDYDYPAILKALQANSGNDT